MNIGQKIKERREFLGLTQEELAKKLGYAGRSSVNKVENSREVSMKKIKEYADALETTVAYLMGWEEQSENIDISAHVDYMFDPDLVVFIETAAKMKKQNEEKFKILKSYLEFLKVEHD